MNASSSDERGPAQGTGGNVQERSRSLKGGHDPAELGRKSGQARRERRESAARDAELDKLTVRARLAVGLAGELTTENLRAILASLVKRAQEPGHVGTNAARLVMELAGKVTEEQAEPDELGDDLQWSDMTPEQRAVARARADALARELGLVEDGENSGEGEGGTLPDRPAV
jgi:hypothetical protein